MGSIFGNMFGSGHTQKTQALVAQQQAEQARKEAEALRKKQEEEQAKADRLEKAQNAAAERRRHGSLSLLQTADGEDTSAVKKKYLLGN